MPQLLPESNSHEDSRVWVLCDGMGGHGHGEVASEVVARSVYSSLSAIPQERIITPDDIRSASDKANEELAAADVYHDRNPMGTTLVVAVLNPDGILVAHAGDSRCYLIGPDGKIKFRSADHSVVGEALAAGILTEEEAFTSSRRNEITRCLSSVTSAVPLDFTELTDIKTGDVLMLCSDGVHDVLRDREIAGLLGGSASIEQKSAALERAVMANAKDNTSAILLLLDVTEKKTLKSRRALLAGAAAVAVLAGAAGFYFMTRSLSAEAPFPLPLVTSDAPVADSIVKAQTMQDTLSVPPARTADSLHAGDSLFKKKN